MGGLKIASIVALGVILSIGVLAAIIAVLERGKTLRVQYHREFNDDGQQLASQLHAMAKAWSKKRNFAHVRLRLTRYAQANHAAMLPPTVTFQEVGEPYVGGVPSSASCCWERANFWRDTHKAFAAVLDRYGSRVHPPSNVGVLHLHHRGVLSGKSALSRDSWWHKALMASPDGMHRFVVVCDEPSRYAEELQRRMCSRLTEMRPDCTFTALNEDRASAFDRLRHARFAVASGDTLAALAVLTGNQETAVACVADAEGRWPDHVTPVEADTVQVDDPRDLHALDRLLRAGKNPRPRAGSVVMRLRRAGRMLRPSRAGAVGAML